LTESSNDATSLTNEANIDSTPASRRLYSVAQITFAAWAASPLAGCLLLNFNYRALEKPRAAWQALVLGLSGDRSCIRNPSTPTSENDVAPGIRSRYVSAGSLSAG
jgi:hypothetical protein